MMKTLSHYILSASTISVIGLVLALAGGAWAEDTEKLPGRRGIETIRPSDPAEPEPFTCQPDESTPRGRLGARVLTCSCEGLQDCMLMQEKGVCSGKLICDKKGCECPG